MATILILDDDDDFRDFVVNSLAFRGHECLAAGRIARADEFLAEGAVDLLIVDGLLPDGSGLEWLERLHREGQRAPAFFVSNFYHDGKSRDRLRIVGAEGFSKRDGNLAGLLEQVHVRATALVAAHR